jgi:pilus assembly protein CpaF
MSFDVILPFLRPIAHLILDPTVSEIMVNPSGLVFIEREGHLEEMSGLTVSEHNLQAAVRNIARALGDDISEDKPLLDSRLPDGSRVAAVVPPCSLGGTALTIRKFQSRRFTVEELVRVGTFTNEAVAQVRHAIACHENVLISGGTGTGKTTVLNAFVALLPTTERIIVIEDTAELQLDQPNLVRFEARIHANSAHQALARFTSCVLQSGVELPYKAIRHQIADSIQLLLHLERRQGQRTATELLRVVGYDQEQDRYLTESLDGVSPIALLTADQVMASV